MRLAGFRPLHPSARWLTVALIGAVFMMALACGGDEIDPNATPTPRPPDTIAPELRTPLPTPLPTNTPAPTPTPGVPPGGFKFTVGVNGDALEFDSPGVLFVQPGAPVEVTLNNISTINQHNWVLVEDGSKDDVSTRGATFPDGWIDPDDPQVLFKTTLLDPGASEVISFEAPAVGRYQFVCTFPGHNATMFGDFVSREP